MLIKIVILICFLLVGTAHATTYVTTTWDTGTPPATWPCEIGCSESNAFDGWYTSNTDQCAASGARECGLVTSPVHSGTKSYKMNRAAGQTDECDIRHFLSTPTNTLHVRAYYYFDSVTWQYMATNPAADNDSMIHFVFLDTAQSQTGLRMNIRDGAYLTPKRDNYAFFCGQINDNEMWESRTTIHNDWNLMENLDKWLSIEFKFVMTATTSTIYTYIDGVLEFTGTYNDTYQYSAGGTFDDVILSGYTNAPDFGQRAAVFYIDDIVVADSYIGPIAGTTPTATGCTISGASMQ